MNKETLTFRSWIQNKILSAVNHKFGHNPLLIWCDPQNDWKDILQQSLSGCEIQLWSDEVHELVLRNRFVSEPSSPRLIWLPVDQREIGYFTVIALQADQIFQMSIAEALDDFGVDIPVDQLPEVESSLPAHALQWIDFPLATWKEKFSVGEVKISLVDDETILSILASPGKSLLEWISKDRLSILNQRIVNDFGLPPLYEGSEPKDLLSIDADSWRVNSTAALLITQADESVPNHPPGDQEKVIHNQAARKRAIKLLSLWQNKFDQVIAFEKLALKADAVTTLPYWAKNLPAIPSPLASPTVESIWFQMEMEVVAKHETFEDLADYLSRHIDTYRDHANAYWGERAQKRVKWSYLVSLAEASLILKQYVDIEKKWLSIMDAAAWFVESGWRVDWAGEKLLKESNQLPAALIGTRSKLRQAYLRHLDRVNTSFADLISTSLINKTATNPFPYVGEQLTELIQLTSKQPVAIIITDACRYDIGCRLAEVINQAEPIQRAKISPACAPIPTITPFGMAYALPDIGDKFNVQIINNTTQPWLITAEHHAGNLAEAAKRREWLKEKFKIKDQGFLSIDQVLNNDNPETVSSKKLGHLVFVFGDEFDDHEGILKPFGLDGVIGRYASLIRRLQSGGFNTIFLVTDHGFFQWEPSSDEKDGVKPEGDILWKSRRAIVGRNLKHNTALTIKIPGSDFDCWCAQHGC